MENHNFRKYIVGLAICLLLVAGIYKTANAWGFWAHKRINRIAVFTLPKEMLGFYKANIEYLTEHAVDPDKRRSVDKNEACRHYIDLDYYGVYPYDSLPRKWDSAVAKYTEDTLRAHGIVPWHIQVMYYRLTDAFKRLDRDAILHISADIGHYIADAHVPLHTTMNYNGQLTGQVGLHAFWESRIPEMFGDNYNYFVGKAKYTSDPLGTAWKTVLESNNALDSVLRFEKELSAQFAEDKKYSFEERGATTVRVYSREYTAAYNEKLSGMVERRVRAAIYSVGCIWMSAWVDAGQPDLAKIIEKKLSKEEKKALEEEEKQYQQGKYIGRPEE
ncbi:MAG: S1/P1 Nuclease [Sphingobacteriales bacterium]|nr:MAG: S1/P1 Nuclease [Sphingobacteriales bacterium]